MRMLWFNPAICRTMLIVLAPSRGYGLPLAYVTSYACHWQHGFLHWFNIDRNERYCTLCNRNEIGDEFHLLFQCYTLRDQRNRFLTKYFINHPNSFKLSVLFNIHSLNKLIRICKLIKIVIGKLN